MTKIYLTAFLLTMLDLSAGAQYRGSTDFYSSIKKYDISSLWRSDSILDEDDGSRFPFPEPLGYIGNNFQRFYIHYSSVVRSKRNPCVYEVSGKTRVRDNICPFKGKITILKADLYKDTYKPGYQQGSLTCAIEFYEDSAHAGSGFFTGRLSTAFCLDKNNHIYYDAVMAVADGYNNNQCTTTWTSYRSGARKICNWGDFRIPESEGLDIGAGVFYVDDKYVSSGWESYRKADGGNSVESKKALAIEDEEWWKD